MKRSRLKFRKIGLQIYATEIKLFLSSPCEKQPDYASPVFCDFFPLRPNSSNGYCVPSSTVWFLGHLSNNLLL
jgi:hypothetical protein